MAFLSAVDIGQALLAKRRYRPPVARPAHPDRNPG